MGIFAMILCFVLCQGNLGLCQGAEIDLNALSWAESRNQDICSPAMDCGRWQITAIVVDDYCRMSGVCYRLKDMLQPQTGREVAGWYANVRVPQLLKHYGIADTTQNRIWAWNAGIGSVLKGQIPSTTRQLLRRYLDALGGTRI